MASQVTFGEEAIYTPFHALKQQCVSRDPAGEREGDGEGEGRGESTQACVWEESEDGEERAGAGGAGTAAAETLLERHQLSNDSCGEVWTEYHDMSWAEMQRVARQPIYTAGGISGAGRRSGDGSSSSSSNGGSSSAAGAHAGAGASSSSGSSGSGGSSGGGVIDLLRRVAPQLMARADALYSYGVAGDLSDPAYEQPKYWSNPLETT